MKKMLLVLVAVAFVSSFCFIQPPSAKAADDVKILTGKVESFTKTMGKPPKWIYGMLTVAADTGEKAVIYVLKATAVSDASGKDMTEGGKKLGALFIKKGERVEVSYLTEKNGRNEAASIRCLD